MRRYSRQEESPMVQSYLELKNKPLASSRTAVNSTLVRNPESEMLRLPQLNPSMRRSSSFTSERNTKFRLQNIDERLEELAAEVHNTRLETQETILHLRAARDSLANKEIENVREDLRKQARGLERLVRATVASDQERYGIIRQDCGQLWNETEHLRSMIFQLRMRTDKLEDSMGFKRI